MTRTLLNLMLLTLLAWACLSINAQPALAQEDQRASQTTQTTAKPKDDDTNLDTQLYLIVGTNQEVTDAKLPAAGELGAQLLLRNDPLGAA